MGYELLIIFLIIFVIYYSTGDLIRQRWYEKMYPLNLEVEMLINREYMNNQYHFLTDQEKEILNYTSDFDFSIFLTRRVTNELVITVKKDCGEERKWTVYKNNEYIERWTIYLDKGYFKKK